MQKLHLLSSIALLQRYSAVADNEELQGQLLSLLPARLMLSAGASEPQSPTSGASTGSVELAGGTNTAMETFGVDWVRQVTSWFFNLIFLAQAPPSSAASPLSPSSSPSASSPSSAAHPLLVSHLSSICSLGHLPQFFNCLAAQLNSALSLRRSQSAHAKVLLFAALLRSLHINVRLVHAVEQSVYPWEQQGWMDELRRVAVSSRVKVDVGQLKEMRIAGKMVAVVNKRDNLRRLWRVALPRRAVESGGECACGGRVEWRHAGLAGSVVPPVRTVSLLGRSVSLSRGDDSDRDEVVLDDDEVEDERGRGERKEREAVKSSRGKTGAQGRSVIRKVEEDENTPLASKAKAKKEKPSVVDAKPTKQRQSAKRKPAAANTRPTSPVSAESAAVGGGGEERVLTSERPATPVSSHSSPAVKAEAGSGGSAASGGEMVKRKRAPKAKSAPAVQRHTDEEEGEEDDAAVYAANLRRRKAKAGKLVKDEKGQRRSERVKLQAEADVIVLSSDDEEAVTRIKEQAEEKEREMLRRLQDEDEEEAAEEEDEEEDDENVVRPIKTERVSGGKRARQSSKQSVKRRLIGEENLVSSDDDNADSRDASQLGLGDHAKLSPAQTADRRLPARQSTVKEEEKEEFDIPLAPAAVDTAAGSVTSAVDAMMDEAKQADSSSEARHHAVDDSREASRVQDAHSAALSQPAKQHADEEVKEAGGVNVQRTACYVCGSHRPTASNPILLCDGCDHECHIKCAIPPLSRVPKGNWYCYHCAEMKEGGADEGAARLTEEKEAEAEGSGAEDESEDDFVPQKRSKAKRGVGSQLKKEVKVKKQSRALKSDESMSQPRHVFDRYHFQGQAQAASGKEEKAEPDEAAKDEEKEEDAAAASDGENSSVMEDVAPRKKQKATKKQSTRKSSSSSPSASSSSPSRSRRRPSATASSPTAASPSGSSPKSKRGSGGEVTGLFLPFWVEVYCPSKECWVHVDPVNNLVDAPHTYESLRPRRTLSYVLAAYPPVAAMQRAASGFGGFASASAMALAYMGGLSRVILDDVTHRYGVGSAMLPRGRLGEAWWQATLDMLSAPRASAFDRSIREEEQALFNASRDTSLSELPTTLATLKKHPLYTSLDQVKKFEMLRPGAPIAARTTVGKQQVALYWRKDVYILHTVERWVREKRQVRNSEVATPSKVVKSQTMAGRKKRRMLKYAQRMQGDFDRLSLDAAMQDAAASSSAFGPAGSAPPDEDEMSLLYGVWQTDPWAPPSSSDGLVPKNARGQVDLWTAAHLPLGCVHLPYPRIAAIARKLGVDHAEAMVGFEVRGGRSIPKFEGIVVVERNAEMVLDAYREREAEVAAREAKKRWERVSFNWRRLVKGSVVRAKLMNELKERNESLEGKDEEQQKSVGGKKGGKGKRRGKKGQEGDEAEPDEEEEEEEAKGKKARKRRVPKGASEAEVSNDLTHVHDFTSNKTMNQETGTWTATCRCGARNEFEDL